MARSESLEKGGYYAFPEDELVNLAKLFRPSTTPVKIFDPCAGEGVALETMAKAWNATAYAVELEYHRAEKCIAKFGENAIFGDFYNTDISPKAFGVVYCNPPFTADSTSPFKRREIDMLNKSWKHVAEGGYMVFVSYNHHLNMQASMEIASRCKQWWLYRLPARHFGEYCFTVLVGQVGKPTNKLESAQELTMLAKNVDSIPLLEEATPLTLPTFIPTKGFYFRPLHNWTTSDRMSYKNYMLRVLDKYGAERNAQFKTTYENHATEAKTIRPVVRPKTGHLVTLIAGGMLDYLPLITKEGNRAMLRSTVKYVEELVKTEEAVDNTKETYHLRPAVTITLLHETGRLEKFTTDEDITHFISEYKAQLFKYVEDKFTPRYQILGDSPEKRKWLPHMKRQRVKGKFELFPAQQHVGGAVCTTLDQIGKALLIGEMSTGKAQPLDAKILTPTGWKLMGDMQVGDSAINSQGGTSKVLGVFPQGNKEVYRVTFNDGSSTECCDDHLWQINTFLNEWKGKPSMVKPLKEFRHKLRDGANNRRYRIPMVKPIEFEANEDLPLDPYFLGLLIGDGGISSKNTVKFSTPDIQLIEAIQKVLPEDIQIKHQIAYDWRISGDKYSQRNSVLDALRSLELQGKRSEAKFIPNAYKYASAENRLALLQGLMDTDGYGHITPSYSTVSHQLAIDVQELVWSLGGYASVIEQTKWFTYLGERKQGQKCYTISIHLPASTPVFRLKRKLEAHQKRTALKANPVRSIECVEFVGVKECQCIKVDSPDHLYVTDDFILTHNTNCSLSVMDAWHKEGKVKPSQIMLVTCPSHLVYKWKREAELQLPHAHVTTLVLEDKSGRHDMLAEFAQAMKQASATPNALHIVIASQDSIKLGEGWSPAYNMSKTYTKEIKRRDEAFICPTTGDLLKNIRDVAQLSKAPKGRKVSNKRGREQWHSLWQETRKIGLPKGNNGRVKVLPNGELKALTPEPILDKWLAKKGVRASSNPRAPLWRLIKSQYKGRIALFVIDETHQSQNIASDRYRSMSNIARCSDAILGLTGTIFNGYASSLYGLETLFNPSLFERYEWGNAGLSAFARDMGVLEKVIENRRELSAGHWAGTKRIVHTAKEIPGASPLLIQMVLDHAVFLSLKDIGKSLPTLKETPVGIEMSLNLSASYRDGERILKNHWDASRRDGDSSFLASYFISRLAYPDTAFEAMPVIHTHLLRDEHGRILDKTEQLVHTFPAIEDLPLPKEQWLIDTVKAEIAQGRGVGIFVLQTDKRDMQPRIAVLLEELAGAKTVILTRDVKGVDREEYIEKAFEQGANVLICNPRLVETGLDIVQCPTLIFIAPEYQLSVLAQASRRHWRIPQTKDCKTFYLFYEETIQEQAMGLITKKLSSLSVLNGDSASVSALSQIGDILEELIDENISFKNLSDEFAIINNRTFDDSEWIEADTNEPPKPTPINTDSASGAGASIIANIKASLKPPKQLSLI